MKLITLIFLLLGISAHGALVSNSLSEEDRREVVKTLGHASSLKVLGDPYPLGGYSGFEFGITIESVPTESFVDLGDKTAGGELLTYPVVSIGKGLYHNIDIFGHFSLFGTENRVGVYGGMIRWGFYESPAMPLTLSLSLQTSSNNFDNLITGEVFAALLNMGLNFKKTSLYMGLGKVNSKAEFSKDLNNTPSSETVSAEDTQFKVGGVYHLRPYFIAVEFNRYVISHFSARLGIRF